MAKALDKLNALIERGWEFPDALMHCVSLYNVKSGKLAVEYDNQFN